METSIIAVLALVCSVVVVHAYKTDAPDFSNEPLTTLPPVTATQQLYILLLNFVSGNLPPGAPLPAGFIGPLMSGQIPSMIPPIAVAPPVGQPISLPPIGIPAATLPPGGIQPPSVPIGGLAKLAPETMRPSYLSPEIPKMLSSDISPF